MKTLSQVILVVLIFAFLPACSNNDNNPTPPTATVTYQLVPYNVSSFTLTYTAADGSDVIVSDNTGAGWTKDISAQLPFAAHCEVTAYRRNSDSAVRCSLTITSGSNLFTNDQSITADSITVETSGTIE